MNGRRPDYKLTAHDRDTGKRGHIGVGWINPDGSISLQLNMLTVIDTTTNVLTLTMIPNDQANRPENNGYVRENNRKA